MNSNTLWPECEGSEDEQHSAASFDRESPRRMIEAGRLNSGAFISALRKQARFAAVVGKISKFRAILSELFLGEIKIEFEDDPEIPGKQYLVFAVQADGDLKEIAKRRREWYNQTCELLGSEAELVQLVVTVRE